MTVRPAVRDLVNLGPFPDSDSATEDAVERHGTYLDRIERPVTGEEAELLLTCFGPDDCYGLAWGLLHLIETAPGGIPIKQKPAETDNEWIRLLWERSHRPL
jgi:hypothetical protein